ncbi:MAG: hypothetical protein AAGA63_09955 [Pseudomonadota bacterium]
MSNLDIVDHTDFCRPCRGKGKIEREPCHWCRGTGLKTVLVDDTAAKTRTRIEDPYVTFCRRRLEEADALDVYQIAREREIQRQQQEAAE